MFGEVEKALSGGVSCLFHLLRLLFVFLPLPPLFFAPPIVFHPVLLMLLLFLFLSPFIPLSSPSNVPIFSALAPPP